MVVLLDAFNAAPEVNNWVTAGNAMATLAGSGLGRRPRRWRLQHVHELGGRRQQAVGDLPR